MAQVKVVGAHNRPEAQEREVLWGAFEDVVKPVIAEHLGKTVEEVSCTDKSDASDAHITVLCDPIPDEGVQKEIISGIHEAACKLLGITQPVIAFKGMD